MVARAVRVKDVVACAPEAQGEPGGGGEESPALHGEAEDFDSEFGGAVADCCARLADEKDFMSALAESFGEEEGLLDLAGPFALFFDLDDAHGQLRSVMRRRNLPSRIRLPMVRRGRRRGSAVGRTTPFSVVQAVA